MNEFFTKNIEKVMKFIGGKWKTIIIANLMTGEKRFNELKKTISSITQRALSLQLKELEDDHIVQKREIEGQPGKFIYILTDLGKSLNNVITELAKWGDSKLEN